MGLEHGIRRDVNLVERAAQPLRVIRKGQTGRADDIVDSTVS